MGVDFYTYLHYGVVLGEDLSSELYEFAAKHGWHDGCDEEDAECAILQALVDELGEDAEEFSFERVGGCCGEYCKYAFVARTINGPYNTGTCDVDTSIDEATTALFQKACDLLGIEEKPGWLLDLSAA